MDYTPEQFNAIRALTDCVIDDDDLYKLGGFAGTGKTTIAKEVLRLLRDSNREAGVCAFTGKAASVLRSKGIHSAQTIHSLIYALVEDEDEDGNPVYEWRRKSIADLDIDCFMVDEASMLSEELFTDMSSYGLPILAIGDPGQLPPVSDSDLNLMADPDMVLAQIHRQAEGSGIIKTATDIRTGSDRQALNLEYKGNGDVTIAPAKKLWDMDWDVWICGYNNTRHTLNDAERARLGRMKKDVLTRGEKIICLANDRQQGVFNGLLGTVTTEPEEKTPTRYDGREGNRYQVLVQWEGEEKPRLHTLNTFMIQNRDRKVGYREQNRIRRKGDVLIDYGYALTCHKAQGSQWDRVAIVNEGSAKLWSQKRWLYTAVTRAAEKVGIGTL